MGCGCEAALFFSKGEFCTSLQGGVTSWVGPCPDHVHSHTERNNRDLNHQLCADEHMLEAL